MNSKEEPIKEPIEEPIKEEDTSEDSQDNADEVLKKDVEVVLAEEVKRRRSTVDKEAWKPKTSLGMRVKNGEITDINTIFDTMEKIMEPEIVDILLPNLTTDLLMVGQSKGKFGGGQKRAFKQTQKKTREGNKPKFSTVAIIGNEDGYVGMGIGKSKETVPAREKAIRNAKLNLIRIRRGNGSWEDTGKAPNTIPFAVNAKSGSVKLKLLPAPRGTGLCVQEECKKLLRLAGIKDIWSNAQGKTGTKLNLLNACFDALRSLVKFKVANENMSDFVLVEGKV